jgi:hypothetical protein
MMVPSAVLFLLLLAPRLTEPLPLTFLRTRHAPSMAAAAGADADAQAAPLLAPASYPLPLGAVRASGWLEQQLRIQRDGLAGHLQHFYEDIGAQAQLRALRCARRFAPLARPSFSRALSRFLPRMRGRIGPAASIRGVRKAPTLTHPCH